MGALEHVYSLLLLYNAYVYYIMPILWNDFLLQLLSKCAVHLSDLADIIIAQKKVGSVVLVSRLKKVDIAMHDLLEG